MTDPLESIEQLPEFGAGSSVRLTRYGLLLEAALFGLAIGLSFLGLYDHEQKLSEWHQLKWQMPVVVGLIAVIPMVLVLLAVDRFNFSIFREIRAIADQLLHPLFEGLSLWKILLISLSAGIGEEFLFRWCLQGGIRECFDSPALGIGVSILIASFLFGICHWLSFAYALYAFFVGVYFGVIMELSDSVLTTIVAHAVYDFVALVYIVYLRKPGPRSRPRRQGKSSPPAGQSESPNELDRSHPVELIEGSGQLADDESDPGTGI